MYVGPLFCLTSKEILDVLLKNKEDDIEYYLKNYKPHLMDKKITIYLGSIFERKWREGLYDLLWETVSTFAHEVAHAKHVQTENLIESAFNSHYSKLEVKYEKIYRNSISEKYARMCEKVFMIINKGKINRKILRVTFKRSIKGLIPLFLFYFVLNLFLYHFLF